MSTNSLRRLQLENVTGEPLRSTGLRRFVLAAIAACASSDASVSADTPEFRLLQDRIGDFPAGGYDWHDEFFSYRRAPDPVDHPLLRLGEELGLRNIEVLAVALAAAVETDVVVGRAIARLQAPLGSSRPTLALLATCFGTLVDEDFINPIDAIVTGNAVQSGLLAIINESVPLSERTIAVPVPLCLALAGLDSGWPWTVIGLPDAYRILLPPSFLDEARRQAAGLRAGVQRTLVLRSASFCEGRSVACEIASALDRRPLFIDADRMLGQGSKAPNSVAGLGTWMLLRELVPVFCYELGPGDTRTLPALSHYAGPMLAVCGHDGTIETTGETPLLWRLPIPSPDERARLWHNATGDRELAARLGAEHRHGSGRIASLGKLARHHGIIDGRAAPSLADIVSASKASEGSGLAGLAQHLPDPIPDDAIVMTATLHDELHRLLRRCRNRDRLVDGLGSSAVVRYKPGVRTLFVGPSGTGKTLAAGWLATRLGMPLYRVDLAAVTSKYIGETEKNLAQLLSRAEHDEIVLLFDEADSLFAKRTDVREANDRFANAQTNYLLQRIETFEGIAVLTSNNRSRFDAAFARRLDMIVEFPPPRPEERRALWLSHLGAGHSLSRSEINQLATAELCGGDIRNTVLAASVPARDERRSIAYADILTALAAEFRKLGREMPSDLARRDSAV